MMTQQQAHRQQRVTHCCDGGDTVKGGDEDCPCCRSVGCKVAGHGGAEAASHDKDFFGVELLNNIIPDGKGIAVEFPLSRFTLAAAEAAILDKKAGCVNALELLNIKIDIFAITAAVDDKLFAVAAVDQPATQGERSGVFKTDKLIVFHLYGGIEGMTGSSREEEQTLLTAIYEKREETPDQQKEEYDLQSEHDWPVKEMQ